MEDQGGNEMRLNDNNTFIGINPPYQLSVIHSSKLIYPRSISFFSCRVVTCWAMECFMMLKDSAS